MIPVLSRAQMRAFDARAIEVSGVPSILLMENAGRGAADVIERELLGGRAKNRRIVVVCGSGNNGGDGFVVARHLLARGGHVIVWLAGAPAKMTPDCRTNHGAFVGLGGTVEIVPLGGPLDGLGAALSEADVIVDALFGTGLDRVVVEPIASVVALLQEARGPYRRARVAALDVPSGLNTDTGVSMGATVEADLTVTFAFLKLGQVTGRGARKSGPVHVVDIGVPPELMAHPAAQLVESSDVRALLGKRRLDTHKYRAGHVALLAGSPGKVGAALLAARGALRGGAGAATIVTWPDAAAALESRVVEVMVARIASTGTHETMCRSADEKLVGKRALVVGPGFGTGEAARAVSRHVLSTYQGPIVGDADVFTIHAGAPEDFAVAAGRVILTPHAGELGRLLGRTSEEIEADRFAAAREAAARANAVVLLKGAYTVVAAPEGHVVVSGSGSPALATAGSGDVLSGLIGALACALPPFEAAYCGAFLHGVSGSAWQKEHGDRGLVASEIADGLPDVLAALLADD
ncbi:MAG TPA: NAD(P)H-hydrate dehydratase [Labilithrix sp.]|nr:NAD(P)H-hydrate dehydratase [Labilithrix sp.]